MIFFASVASAACDIPAAVFDGGTSNGGSTTSHGGSTEGGSAGQSTATHGGSGGTGGSMGTGGSSTGGVGGTTTSSSSTSSTLTGPTVTCNYPNNAECLPMQSCCYDRQVASDTCVAAGTCDPPSDYIEVKCDQTADCAPAGKICCAHYVTDVGTGMLTLEKTYCDTACDFANGETNACIDDNDCTFPLSCLPIFGMYYPDSLFCLGG